MLPSWNKVIIIIIIIKMRAFADRFISQDFTHISVNDMGIEFKTVFLKAVDKLIPSKMTKGKLGSPWIDARIRALVMKKEQEKNVP